MIFRKLKTGIGVSDEDFDLIYSRQIREVSKTHFTPVEVAKTASRYLVDKPGTRVLDVGSGAGKFCMVGAACTEGFFIGVEQRLHLYELSGLLSGYHQLTNTMFIHDNITAVEFDQFDAIYFFNAFYENIFRNNPVDFSVPLDKTLYVRYSGYMREQLAKMPVGTRLATYFSFMDEIPDCYKLQSTHYDRKLKLWEKAS